MCKEEGGNTQKSKKEKENHRGRNSFEVGGAKHFLIKQNTH